MTIVSRFSGGKFKAARNAAGLSQRQFAYRLNVSSSSVLRWEKRACNPVADKLPAIAEILGIEITDLFEEVES